MDFSGEHVLEERDPDLNEEEDIIMDDTRDEDWRDVAEDCDNKKKIHALRWEIYVKEKEGLICREFLVSVPHPEGGNIVCIYVKDHIIEEKEQYKAIRLRGFGYKLFEEEVGGGVREVLDGYPYLKHLLQLWLGYRVKQMAKMNEAVGMKNRLMVSGGKKRLVRPFNSQEFWKCISFILSAVTCGKKGHNFWSELPFFWVRSHQLNYKEMFVGTQIYISYVVISNVIITVMLAIKLLYFTQLCSFLGCFFE